MWLGKSQVRGHAEIRMQGVGKSQGILAVDAVTSELFSAKSREVYREKPDSR
jgi:hypothetical protein